MKRIKFRTALSPRVLTTFLSVLLLVNCGGGGGSTSENSSNTNKINSTEPVNINEVTYIEHGLVQNHVRVTLPYWEPTPPVQSNNNFHILKTEIEPDTSSTGDWRSFFLVIESDTLDDTFIREIRNVELLSSRELVIDGFPAYQYIYEAQAHLDVYKGEKIGVQRDDVLDDTKWIPDSFRFLQTTVNVGDKFYTLLYAAEKDDFARYELVANHLSESMHFGLLLPLQSSLITSNISSKSIETQTLLSYCEKNESDFEDQVSLKTLQLVSRHASLPPITVETFPERAPGCSVTGLAFDGATYLLTYTSQVDGINRLHARFLNIHGEPIDNGFVLETASITNGSNAFEHLKTIYDGERFFLAWTQRNQNSEDSVSSRSLVGLFLDNNYTASEKIYFVTNLIGEDDEEYRRLDIAQTDNTIALVWDFPTLSTSTPPIIQLSLLDNKGNKLSNSPIVVRDVSTTEKRDIHVEATGSSYSVFWVERILPPESTGEFDDLLMARQYNASGQALEEALIQVMGPFLDPATGDEYEKNKLIVNQDLNRFYFLWESGKKYEVGKFYSLAATKDLTSRSEAIFVEHATSGTLQKKLIIHDSESIAAWLPAISANLMQVWPFPQNSLEGTSWEMTENTQP